MSYEEECLDSLYNLDMMESEDIAGFEVTRVPGGWIFKSVTKHYEHSNLKSGSESMIFIPFTEVSQYLDRKK